MTQLSSGKLKETFDFCEQIADSREIVAACLYGPHVYGYADCAPDLNVLLVIRGFQPKLMSYFKSLAENNVLIFAVDQKIFERDVKHGWLGELVAGPITTPYDPLTNDEYLYRQEVRVKKRMIWQLLENLVLEFPEFCNEFLIRPEYFMYEIMARWTRLFPLITYRFLNMMRKDVKEKNEKLMMKGYLKALDELAEESWISFSNRYVKINKRFIDKTKGRRGRFLIFFRSIRRAFFSYAVGILPKMIDSLLQDREIFMKSHGRVEAEKLVFELKNPKEYLLIPTKLRSVPFSDRTSIKDFAHRIVSDVRASGTNVQEMGGVLNSVYLLTMRKDHKRRRVVVKKFKDWLGLKWFPLALWTLGTRSFAVLGRSRLEREYAINQFLSNHGFDVPTILYVSPQERLIFEEFIEGISMTETIKSIISSKKEKAAAEVHLVRELGKKIAQIHQFGVSLGDCKPENIIVTEDGKIYFLDLEQATRDGNQTWDVAEFLYFSGHYLPLVASVHPAELIATSFIEGYLEAGGNKEIVKEAGSVQYTKLFSVFTPPHVMLAISNICKRAGS